MIMIMSHPLADDLSRLPSRGRSFAAGAFLFHRGDAVRSMHWVEAGAVHLLRRQDDGSALILQRAGPGTMLAEASLFALRYHCDAVTAAATRTRTIAAAAIQDRLRVDPDFAGRWIAHLAGEVQAARLRAEILSLKTVAARLDAWIAWRDGRLPPRGAWSTLAAELGISPEALYRELAARRARG